jgi:hypothetical protein
MIRIRKPARATITASRIALPVLLPNPPRPHTSPLARLSGYLKRSFKTKREPRPGGSSDRGPRSIGRTITQLVRPAAIKLAI